MEITIDRVECMGISYYGNPYYRVFFTQPDDDHYNDWLRTSINAGVNYEITNYRRGDEVNVKLTRAGRIYAIERV